MYKTPSFSLDHTKVQAPYIRLAYEQPINSSAFILKYDIRIFQPNKGVYMSSPGAHALEHCLSEEFHAYCGSACVDVSVMGCLTGVYFTLLSDSHQYDAHCNLIIKAFKNVLNYNEVPGATEVSCGNYKMMNLSAAKEYCTMFIDGISRLGTKGYLYKGYNEVHE